MTIKTVLANDKSEIRGIYGPNDVWVVQVDDRTDKIEAYIEDGNAVWFACIKDDKITQRINSVFVEAVTYK